MGILLYSYKVGWAGLKVELSAAELLGMLSDFGGSTAVTAKHGVRGKTTLAVLTSPRSLQCNSHFTAARKN